MATTIRLISSRRGIIYLVSALILLTATAYAKRAQVELRATTTLLTNGSVALEIDVSNTGELFLRDMAIRLSHPDNYSISLTEGAIGPSPPLSEIAVATVPLLVAYNLTFFLFY